MNNNRCYFVMVCGSEHPPILRREYEQQQTFIPIFDSLYTNKYILYFNFYIINIEDLDEYSIN